MTVNSLQQSGVLSSALYGLTQAGNQIQESTYRLSSGDRFYRAGDDVAALSISNRLQSQIVGTRQAIENNTLANSMLQTAYNGLQSISDVLNDMQALATQGNSGSLTAADRAILDLEFQGLRDEVDRLANETSFNGINLIDGSVSEENDMQTTTTNATQASGSITFTANPGVGDTVVLNGTTLVADTDFTIGGSIADTVSNLAGVLNNSTDRNVNGANYLAVGNTLNITARSGGTLGENFIIDQASSTATFTTVGQNTDTANVFALDGGQQDGLSIGSTRATGTVNDSLVNTFDQTSGSATLTILANNLLDNNEGLLSIDDGDGGTVNFRARTTTIAAAEDFLIGATAEETLQNLVSTIENYSTDSDFVLNQLDFEINGDTLTITGRGTGSVLDQNSAAANLTETAATNEAFLSATTLGNGTDTGVNTDGVVNADFTGTISGFSATFNGADDITASITVGSTTYTAEIDDTTPAADTYVRFNSTDGGYFDVELSGGNGLSVADQTDADTYASRLDAAFSGLNFYQSREISNFIGSGQLAGGNAQLRLDDFSDTQIDEISVNAASGSVGASVDITIGDEIFRAADLGDTIGADETITLRSLNDSERQITIQNGSAAIDLTSAANASTFEDTLDTNFGIGSGTGELSFQVGSNAADQISISIGSATSDSLFNGASPDLTSQVNSAAAETVIQSAIDELNSIIAEVGSTQSSLDYALNAASSNVIELESAYSTLADTDIASESTLYATAVVQQQAAISVLAQGTRLGSNLLDLLAVG